MDPVTSASFTSILASMGLPGLVIAALGYAVFKLYTRNNELQDKRIEESRETLTAMNNMATALGNLANIIEKRNTP